MPTTDVICDASVALKWFHSSGEEEVEPARALLTRHRSHELALHVVDLTFYEVGNALLRGRARVTAAQVGDVLDAIHQIVLVLHPDQEDFVHAADLASTRRLTLYDAIYAAVAHRRDAPLVTHDRQLLAAALGVTPAALVGARPG